QREIAGSSERDADQDDHDQPRVRHVVGDVARRHEEGQAEDRRMLDGFHAQPRSRAEARPRAITAQGRTLKPATSATGWAQPDTRSSPQATMQAANRRPAPSSHAAAGAPPAAIAAAARAASHRKFTTARAPPASTPSAATPAHTPSVTRTVSSPVVIEIPLRPRHRSKEVDESRRDAEPEADQEQPGLRSQPPIRVVSGDEPDDRRHHQRETDRR